MGTFTPNLALFKPDDNPAGGGDDLVDVTLDISNALDILDDVIGDADSVAPNIHDRLLVVEAATGAANATLYTPLLTATTTNPNLGTTPVQEGWYFQIGKLVIGGFSIQLGTGATAGSGLYLVSLPVSASVSNPMRAATTEGTQDVLGSMQVRDTSVPTILVGIIVLHSSTNMRMRTSGTASESISATSPFTWNDGDRMFGSFSYIAA